MCKFAPNLFARTAVLFAMRARRKNCARLITMRGTVCVEARDVHAHTHFSTFTHGLFFVYAHIHTRSSCRLRKTYGHEEIIIMIVATRPLAHINCRTTRHCQLPPVRHRRTLVLFAVRFTQSTADLLAADRYCSVPENVRTPEKRRVLATCHTRRRR